MIVGDDEAEVSRMRRQGKIAGRIRHRKTGGAPELRAEDLHLANAGDHLDDCAADRLAVGRVDQKPAPAPRHKQDRRNASPIQ